jgi:hypothetical protein
MLSLDWHVVLASAPLEQRAAASQELIQTQQGIVALSNAVLSNIASQMQANEAGLSSATAALEKDLATSGKSRISLMTCRPCSAL